MVSTDTTILNVALPSVSADLGASIPDLQWTLDAYTLVLGSLLLFAGSVADRWGRRRTLQVGLAVFSLGSLLCSLAPGVEWLIAARVLQACGASMINPVTISIISVTFPERAARARAIGIWGMFTGAALAVGPLLGGLLTEIAGWRSVFWVTVPIGLAALVLAAVIIPESRSARRRRADPIGQLLVIIGLGLLVGGLIEAPRGGTGQTIALAMLGGFVVAAAVFIVYERRRFDPLVDPRFFRSLPFSAAIVSAVCIFTGYGSALFLTTFYLQQVRGLSPPEAGFVLLPMAVVTTVASLVSGRLLAARGPRLPFAIAASSFIAGGLCLTGLQDDSPLLLVIVALSLIGLGFGAVNTPITTTAVAGMPQSRAGSAAAIGSSARQVGMALGVAIAGLVVHGTGESYARSTHSLWWTVALLGLIVLVLSLLATGKGGRESMERMRHLLDE
jgi:EmrB/QacA subfamily drug resistance transporter